MKQSDGTFVLDHDMGFGTFFPTEKEFLIAWEKHLKEKYATPEGKESLSRFATPMDSIRFMDDRGDLCTPTKRDNEEGG